jgi:hypothetical protein
MTDGDENPGDSPETDDRASAPANPAGGVPSEENSDDGGDGRDGGSGRNGGGGGATGSSDDRPLVYGLGTAVGAFAVLGVGLVLTSFFVVQFGGGGGADFGVPLSGAGGGLGFAVVLSPVLAVLLGVVLGREGATPVDAAASTAVGFVTMYLVTAVVAGSLFGPSSGLGIGPLAGYTVGVALAGGLATAVADRDLAVPVGTVKVGRPAAFGVAVLATYAVGTAVSAVLAGELAGPANGAGPGQQLFSAASTQVGLSLGMLFVPVVGLLAGYLGVSDDASDQSTAVTGGAAAGVAGAVVATVVLYVAAIATGPGGPFPVGTLVGLAVGTGLTGAGAGYVAVSDRQQLR